MSPEEVLIGIHRKEFKYFLQPVFNALEARVEGFEALLRWVRAERTLTPGEFLDEYYLATQSEKLIRYRYRSLRDAIEGLDPSTIPGWISFNVRIEDLTDKGDELIIDILGPLLAKRSLVVEFNEQDLSARSDAGAIAQSLQRLREAGFKIALDDFGKDSSNLNRLLSWPIDMVKIDRLFVSKIESSPSSQRIVQAIASVALSSGIKIVAEGIETSAESKILIKFGIHTHQGFLHAKPMPISAIKKITPSPALDANHPDLVERRRAVILDGTQVAERIKDDEVLAEYLSVMSQTLDGVPTAITILKTDCQLLPGRHETDVRQTSRKAALCNLAVLQDLGQIVDIPNTHQDARTKDNDLVTGKEEGIKIASYVGTSIALHGEKIGALAAFDFAAREPLNPSQSLILTELARLASKRISGIVEELPV